MCDVYRQAIICYRETKPVSQFCPLKSMESLSCHTRFTV